MLKHLLAEMQKPETMKEYGLDIIVKSIPHENNLIVFKDANIADKVEAFYPYFGAANRNYVQDDCTQQFITVKTANDDVEVYCGLNAIKLEKYSAVDLDSSAIIGNVFTKDTANPDTVVKSFFEMVKECNKLFYAKTLSLAKIEYLSDKPIADRNAMFGYKDGLEYMQLPLERIPESNYLISRTILQPKRYITELSFEQGSYIAKMTNDLCLDIIHTAKHFPVIDFSVSYETIDEANCVSIKVTMDASLFSDLNIVTLAHPVRVLVETIANVYRGYINAYGFNYNPKKILDSKSNYTDISIVEIHSHESTVS